MTTRGRPPKLSPEQVAALREELGYIGNARSSNKELQAKYGITYLTLRKVKKGLHPYEFMAQVQSDNPQ